VLDLQLEIQNLSALYGDNNKQTVVLEDICFQPMAPDYTDCTIMSALNYWQNSANNLDEAAMDMFGLDVQADYLDHLLACFRSVLGSRSRSLKAD
jgi:Niemann-Pick C1 protein